MGWRVEYRNRRPWGSHQYHHYPRFNRNANWRRLVQWKHQGYQKGTRFWRRRDEVISIFVDNIDPKTPPGTIRNLFGTFGEIVDVYISRKRRVHTPKQFGFIKMTGPSNAFTAIRQIRGSWVDGSKLFVKEARFKRWSDSPEKEKAKEHANKMGEPQETVTKRHGGKISVQSQDSLHPIDADKMIKVNVNHLLLEELERSLIGKTDEPRSVEVLARILTTQWLSISKVRDLGPYTFIITFTDKDEMEHAAKMESSLLSHHFSSIETWDIYHQGDTRRVWLEIMGIPPQVWSRDTCEKIVSKFGNLVCWDSNSENPESFVTSRVMIDTNIMSYISDVLYLCIEEQSIGKSIYVREGTNLTTCYVKQPVNNPVLSSNQWDDNPVELSQEGEKGLGSENEVVEETPMVTEHPMEPEKSVTQIGNRIDSNEEGDAVGEVNVAVSGVGVQDTPVSRECVAETEESVTHIGNVMYDINEEKELIAMRNSNAHFENSFVPLSSEEDGPPGFLRIGRNKGKKRGGKHQLLKNSNTGVRKKQVKSKARNQLLLNEITDGGELGPSDSIEPVSEDDYESDPELESRKSRELWALLGLGGGKKLTIEELLN